MKGLLGCGGAGVFWVKPSKGAPMTQRIDRPEDEFLDDPYFESERELPPNAVFDATLLRQSVRALPARHPLRLRAAPHGCRGDARDAEGASRLRARDRGRFVRDARARNLHRTRRAVPHHRPRPEPDPPAARRSDDPRAGMPARRGERRLGAQQDERRRLPSRSGRRPGRATRSSWCRFATWSSCSSIASRAKS